MLDQYPDVIKSMIRRRAGVYALYRKERLYYVGLASNLMARLKQHLKDRHNGAWDRFSVYLDALVRATPADPDSSDPTLAGGYAGRAAVL